MEHIDGYGLGQPFYTTGSQTPSFCDNGRHKCGGIWYKISPHWPWYCLKLFIAYSKSLRVLNHSLQPNEELDMVLEMFGGGIHGKDWVTIDLYCLASVLNCRKFGLQRCLGLIVILCDHDHRIVVQEHWPTAGVIRFSTAQCVKYLKSKYHSNWECLTVTSKSWVNWLSCDRAVFCFF